jgi:hypothetical protein
MFNWLKMHFIPHEGNGHRPHILHQKNVNRIIGFVIFIELFAFLIPTIALISNADTGNVIPSVLSSLINKERGQFNLPPLKVNEKLNAAAQAKADDMAKNSYFAHTSPEGKTPWFWLGQAGYTYKYAGENLAINFTDAHDVTTAWMNSPAHRANILKANYTEVGTGVAAGVYQGNPTIFVAQDFGNPLSDTAPASVVSKPDVAASAASHTVAVSKPAVSAVLGAQTVSNVPAVPVIADASLSPIHPPVQATFFQRLFASPRTTTNAALFIILGLILISVFLNVGIKINHHHPDLILNGIMAMAIIGSVFVINNYIAKSNPLSAQSIDFSIDHTIL